MQNEYLTLLKKAKAELPKSESKGERFEIPKVTSFIQGSKTIISNFAQICSILRRDQQKLLKYLQRELATPAVIEGPRLVLGRKLPDEEINKRIVNFCHDFVICKECGKPDTQLFKEDRILFMKCTACGAKQPIASKI